MRYVIKQKLLSLADGFMIKDANEQDVFQVKGKVLSLGKKLTVSDLQGNEICYIEQKLMKLMPEYNISVNGQQVMNIKQKMALLKKKIEITGSTGNFTVGGDFFGFDFTIVKDNMPVATISKKLLKMADTYTVDINDNENQPLMLAVAIVMDMIFHEEK